MNKVQITHVGVYFKVCCSFKEFMGSKDLISTMLVTIFVSNVTTRTAHLYEIAHWSLDLIVFLG